MRVLFFNYEYPPLGGGAGNATFYILKEFSRIPGLELDVITSSIDSKYHLDNLGDRVRIHRLPIGKNKKNLHFQSGRDILVYSWRALLFALELNRKNKYDLSHSFFTVPCGFLSFILKIFFKIPYIVSLRGSDVPGYSERFSLLYKLINPLIKLIWENAGAVVANSNGLRELALETNKKQEISIIYNGVDTNHFVPGKKNDEKFIVTLGATRITERKGIKYLIEAVGILKDKYPNIFLKIMGEGSEKESLEKQIGELGLGNFVNFLGMIPGDRTVPFYQEASVFVLPSFNEGMSNAMLEALSCGLPLIATKTGGSDELLIDNKNGFLIETKSSRDIVEKIEKLINNRDLCDQMSLNSRSLAGKMSWKTVAEKYYSLYEKNKRNF